MSRTSIAAALLFAIVTGCGQIPKIADLKLSRAGASDPYLSTRMCVFNFDGKAREVRLRIQLNVISDGNPR